MELPVLQIPDTVVFPGMTVSCELVERNHLLLMQRLLRQGQDRFVATLPPEQLPGAGSRLGSFGTRMAVLAAEQEPGGAFLVTAQGQGRQRLDGMRPASTGSAADCFMLVPDEPAPLLRSDPNDELLEAWDTAALFLRYAERFLSRRLRSQVKEALPAEPFYLASFVCANCRLDPLPQQELLVAPSLIDRLRLVRSFMRSQLAASGPVEPTRAARA